MPEIDNFLVLAIREERELRSFQGDDGGELRLSCPGGEEFLYSLSFLESGLTFDELRSSLLNSLCADFGDELILSLGGGETLGDSDIDAFLLRLFRCRL